MCHSDHAPILLKYGDRVENDRSKKLFRFEALWLSSDECGMVVGDAWNEEVAAPITDRIVILEERLKKWAGKTFGDLKKKIQKTESNLRELQGGRMDTSTLQQFQAISKDDNTATIRCPCDNCRNLVYKKRCDVRFDLLKSGMYEYYTIWDLHGEKGDHLNDYDFNEEPTGDAAMFYHLLKEYEEPLTSNGTTMSKYLGTLKKYIRNRAHPEGCIAEGYLVDECLTFCSRYMSDIDTKFNRKGRNDDDTLNDVTLRNKLDIFRPLGHALGEGAPRHLSFEECDQIHLYNLLNCDELY
uniref:Transposase-associated domain-containing protein n=1 Tax=Chenopodium quinoa TaxID=63459 RepID=A0A803MKH3_CHEQI